MQTLTETTEIHIFLHPDILGVMRPADAMSIYTMGIFSSQFKKRPWDRGCQNGKVSSNVADFLGTSRKISFQTLITQQKCEK